MPNIHGILEYNRGFVSNQSYEEYLTNRFPEKKMVIVTCMDTRLTELLPKAMNLRNGDANIIKNAGGIVTQPFGNIMRSILVAIYEMGAHEVCVIGHHECGMTGLNSDKVLRKIHDCGIKDETIDTLEHSGIHLSRWLTGFDNVHDSVIKSVAIIRNHPLLPKDVIVHGLIIHPATGELELIDEGKPHSASLE